jgi:hypothetical protein
VRTQMIMLIKTLAAVAAGTVLATNAFAQSAREVGGASPYVRRASHQFSLSHSEDPQPTFALPDCCPLGSVSHRGVPAKLHLAQGKRERQAVSEISIRT